MMAKNDHQLLNKYLYHTLYSLQTIVLMSLLIIIVPPQCLYEDKSELLKPFKVTPLCI